MIRHDRFVLKNKNSFKAEDILVKHKINSNLQFTKIYSNKYVYDLVYLQNISIITLLLL